MVLVRLSGVWVSTRLLSIPVILDHLSSVASIFGAILIDNHLSAIYSGLLRMISAGSQGVMFIRCPL
jgi:hypothetical protein